MAISIDPTGLTAGASDSGTIDPTRMPRHIAFIMDGNGRWAKQRGMPRVEGHRAGAKTVRMVAEECRRLGIKYVTLYAFSSENWNRPEHEVGALMGLFHRYLNAELDRLCDNGIRLRAIGDRNRLPSYVVESLERAEERSRGHSGMQLILAVSYGGRDELVTAARRLGERVARGELSPQDITEEMFASSLFTHDIPDPDLLVRTSSEFRISNFLLWQLAYAEIVVSGALWPEFSAENLRECIYLYQQRERRFGLTSEQLAEAEDRDE